jgi:predicted AlkP superfamily phosphohydrolase/phosphomutase
MPLKKNPHPLCRRLLTGIAISVILGILIGSIIALWEIISRTIGDPYTQGMLSLHLAVTSSLIFLLPGLLLSIFMLGRRKDIAILPHGIILLGAVVAFYYGRNLWSMKITEYYEGSRLLVEILGTVGWAVCCWLLYKLLIIIEKRLRGIVVTVSLVVVVCLLGWHVYSVVKPSPWKSVIQSNVEYGTPMQNTKVAILGLDGAWWEIIDPMIETGNMPNFKRLLECGVRANLQTYVPTRSPAIWTTVLTGKHPLKHGISDFGYTKFPITGVVLPFQRIPNVLPETGYFLRLVTTNLDISSTYRRAESLWNILSCSGLTVGVLNWWATHPSEPVNGYVISSHAYANMLKAKTSGQPINDSTIVFPPGLLDELVSFVPDPMEMNIDSFSQFVFFPSDKEWRKFQQISEIHHEMSGMDLSIFKFFYPYDESIIQMTTYLNTHFDQPDFLATYIRGLDVVQHWYLAYYFHEQHPKLPNPDLTPMAKDLVHNYYIYMDEVLGRFLDALDSNTTVIVVSDHGFDHGLSVENRYKHDKGPRGVFIIAGPNIKQNTTIPNAHVEDITPTILSLFGLPIGKDMDGRVLAEVFENDTIEVSWVESYETGKRLQPNTDDAEMDKQTLERLKALGYVK